MNVPDEVHSINSKVSALTHKVDQIRVDVEKLVTRHEFMPVKLIVYGLCGCILTSVLAALLSRVLIT